MTSKKTDVSVAAIATEDGHAILGGRPAAPEIIQQQQRQASGLPPVGVPAPAPVAEPVAQLPYIHVSRQVAGREIQLLKAKAERIERGLARGVIGASGQVVPHLVQMHADARETLARVRDEIDRLESLTDQEVRQWAFEQGAR